MDNQTTQVLNSGTTPQGETKIVGQSGGKAKYSTAKIVAASMVGDLVAGGVAGVVTSAAASAATPQNDVTIVTEGEEAVAEETASEVPKPEQVILANDEGIRYAHVDADNFSEAFAQARRQVGAGGVFEYNGRLYGTYYKTEWDAMTAQEKADYQSRVNEVAPSRHGGGTHAGVTHEVSAEQVASDAEMIAAEPSDSEIRVLGVEAVQNDEGGIMNVALVESDGDHALLVDVDNDGTIDVMLHDDNQDGMLQESEVYDISGAGVEVSDLAQVHAAQGGDYLSASADEMPDYVNDADLMMEV